MAPLSTLNTPVPSRSRPSQTAVAVRVGMIAPLLVVRAAGSRTSRAVAVPRRATLAIVAVLAAGPVGGGRDKGAPAAAGPHTAADSVVDTIPELAPSLVELPVRYELGP